MDRQAEARFRIGNQTAFSAADPYEPFRFALRHGFDAFEWFSDRKGDHGIAWDQIDQERRRWVRDAARDHGVALAVHAPWQASPLTPEGRAALAESIDFARDIGARPVVLHLDPSQGPERFAELLVEGVRRAEDSGVVLAIENTVHTSPEDCNRALAALRGRTGSGASVGLCLDIGHANLCGATHYDYVRFVRELDPELPVVHGHFHENWGDGDHHLLLFTGPSARDDTGVRQVIELLAQRGFAGALTLEVWPTPPEALVATRARLAALVAEVLGTGGANDREARRPEAVPIEDTDPAEPETSRVNPPASGGGAVEPRAHPLAGAVGHLPPRELTPFAAELVQMSSERTSWRRRLEWIAERLEEPDAREPDALLTLGAYLRFLAAGAIACQEDGGHYRPSHHAELALRIERALLDPHPDQRPPLEVVRRVLRYLPSHDAPFRRAEPLTRIRDIAHRNDITGDLKQEIKHTLQNKLHRSAGPEDLATSARLLARITENEGDYPPAFVAEFRQFHAELERFFNVGPLDEDLAFLAEHADSPVCGLARELLERAPEDRARELELGCRLREALRFAYDSAGDARTQRLRVAEMKLEERAFVLTSEIVARFTEEAREPSPDLVVQLARVVELGSRHLATIGLDPRQVASASALLAAQTSSSQERLLLAKAFAGLLGTVLMRFGSSVLGAAADRLQALGRALGVDEDRARLYAEGELRGSLAYPLSRAIELLHAVVDHLLGVSPWQPIVTGQAMGTLVRVEDLSRVPADGDAALVVISRRVAGDEHIPDQVKGLIVEHDLPSLSHLAIRARQARVILAAARSPEAPLSIPEGAPRVRLSVTSDGVTLEVASQEEPLILRDQRQRIEPPSVRIGARPELLNANRIEAGNAGPKAYAARRLLELAAESPHLFRAPPCWALPFGTLELCLRASNLESEYEAALAACEGADAGALGARSSEIARLVSRCVLPRELEQAVQGVLPAGLLAVRSSGNLEDLAGFSAAGLYHSVIGVPPAAVGNAVLEVLASLHSERALLARRAAGLPHRGAHMAVLIEPVLPADLSFVLYTTSPHSDGAADHVYAELAVGLGETLASATGTGTPFRLQIRKPDGPFPRPSAAVIPYELLSFASFPEALAVRDGEAPRVEPVPADYGRAPFVLDREFRSQVARRLALTACLLESRLGGPQDVEGVFVGADLYLAQTRPAVRSWSGPG